LASITWSALPESLVSSVSTVVMAVGAMVQLNAAVSDYPACQNFGKGQDITVRNSLIERGIGEGIYIAGTYTFTRYRGCPTYGNTHRDILIGSNTVREPGSNGEQGDGIDLEGGLLNVTARRNVIQNACAPGAGPGKGGRWHRGGRRVPAGASELPL
jgi:hypothetical protein